jgi:outer membrane receptor protein involved in Fe transport
VVLAIALSPPVSARAADLTLPAQALDESLRELGEQADLNVLFEPSVVRGHQAPAVSGAGSVDDALTQLLTGTGLTYRFIDERTVTLLRVGAGDGRGRSAALRRTAAEEAPKEFVNLAADDKSGNRSGVETPDDSETDLQSVVVTGTYIRRAEPLAPVITLTHDQMIAQGYTRLDQAIDQLPQQFRGAAAQDTNPITAAGSGATNNYSYSSGVNLRGLGPSATLVLLNGRRLAPTAVGASVDISQIPVSAIDRVEILTDGASATYGSDAIGGVVNIITKKHSQGFEAGARTTGMSAGKEPNYGGWGSGGVDWSGGNLLASLDYDHSHPLYARSRDFTRDVPDPTVLLPEGKTKSGYVSLFQSLSDNLTITADVLLSRRMYTAQGSFFGPSVHDGKASQSTPAVQVDYRFTRGWTASLIAQYATEEDSDTDTEVGFRQIQAYEYETPAVDARVDGPVLTLPGGSARVAIGASGRKERFDQDVDALDDGGNSLFALSTHSRRRVNSVYGELLVPIIGPGNTIPAVKQLTFDVAVRRDDYNDFGGTTNPKFSLQWKPSNQLSLRGGYSESFRAPTLFVLDPNGSSAYVYDVADPASSTGTRRAILIDGTNPNLTAETAKSYNFGIAFAPSSLPDFKTELSIFDINYKKKIDHLATSGFFDNVVIDADVLGPLINLNPSLDQINTELNHPGRLFFDLNGTGYTPESIGAIANIGYVNVGTSHVRGLDGTIGYRRDTTWGQFALDTSGSYYLDYDNRLTPTAPEFTVLNTIYNPVRFRAKTNLSWVSGRVSVNGRINHLNSYKNLNDPACAPPGCSVASWTTFDLSASYIPASVSAPSMLDGVRISVDAANLFNRKPPFAYQARGLNYDPTNASPLGRSLAVSVVKRWSGE